MCISMTSATAADLTAIASQFADPGAPGSDASPDTDAGAPRTASAGA